MNTKSQLYIYMYGMYVYIVGMHMCVCVVPYPNSLRPWTFNSILFSDTEISTFNKVRVSKLGLKGSLIVLFFHQQYFWSALEASCLTMLLNCCLEEWV